MRPLIYGMLLTTIASVALANGNVGVGVDRKREISITGDGGNNHIEVRYGMDAQGNDVIVIEGKEGTTIRSMPSLEIPLPDGPRDKIRGISISPGAGGDTILVDLSGLPEGKRMQKVEVQEYKQFDDGDDTVTIRNVQLVDGGLIRVDQDAGNDVSVIDGCDAGVVRVKGSDGDVTIRNCNVNEDLRIEGEQENLVIEDCFYRGIFVSPGQRGNIQRPRRTVIQRTTGRKVSMKTGDGADTISFDDNVIDSVLLKTGGGDDQIFVSNSTIGKFKVNGGAGDNCFDDSQGGNDIDKIMQKKINLLSCGIFTGLEYFGAGSNPFAPGGPPADAVAWRVRRPDFSDVHLPYALPGYGAVLNLPERDPTMLTPPAHWGQGSECTNGMLQLYHVHDAFQGHGDPDPGGCGHGVLEWARSVPI